VVASDPDAGQTLTYSILSGNTNAAFAINASSGVLTVANSAALNFEVTPVFYLVVKVQDNGTGTLSSQATVSVSLTNINEVPVITNQSLSVSENSSNGITVGTVVASDPDAAQTLTFSIISGNTSGAFSINSATGVVSVANSAAVSSDINPSFTLLVKVQDNGTGLLSSQANVNVSLSNINGLPIIKDQSISVSENTNSGTAFGSVVATDPDADQTLTYSILSGNTNDAFVINTSIGSLTVANSSALNFETTPSFALVIKVQDNGTGTLSSQAKITINILDVNEKPVINDQTITVQANTANGTFVETVSASDPDIGQVLTYAIISGNTGNAFTINPSTGALIIANSSALSFETTLAFTLVTKVQDNGTGNLNNQAKVYVNLMNEKSCTATGNISYEKWSEISGSGINMLTSNINYPDNPSTEILLTSMEAPISANYNFGARIAGYICAPITGSYTFWIASDDNSELWLSTDDNQAKKEKIAYHNGYTDSRQWNKYTTQKSLPVNLIQGHSYYVEALMKDGGGVNNFAIGWLKPGQTGLAPSEIVPGSVLSPIKGFISKEETVSNNEIVYFDNVTLFPNPLPHGEVLNVIVKGENPEGFTISVFDITGKVLLQQHYEQQEKLMVNVSAFLSGTYIITIRNRNLNISKKFIVL